ncbi:hypothetical protein [Streptomyces thermovulgaris]|uniref:hypothetical protein n=1 Tax=Streptomyces thermovulgaris TaxID=1934 RepID=UPI0011809AFD|nr:hypothetical protein [Streptomyces thermovulgaris]
MPEERPPDLTGREEPDTSAPVPYHETTEERYAGEYTTGLRILSVDDESVVLSGRCPRCGCACTYLYTHRSFRRPRRGLREQRIPVICTCSTDHPGRPDGEEGCGAYWNVLLEQV